MALPSVFKKNWFVVRARGSSAELGGTLGPRWPLTALGSTVLSGATGLLGCATLLDIESDPKLVKPQTSTSCEGTLRVKLTTDTDSDASGTARDIAPSYNQGIIDYINELNDRADGIRGCPIELEVGEGDNGAIVTEQVIAGWKVAPEWSEVSTLFVFGTSAVKRVASDLAAGGKLVIAGASSGSLASPEPLSRDVVHPLVGADGTESSVTEDVSTVGYPNVFFVGMDDSTIARGLLAAISAQGGGRVALVADVDCAFCVDPMAAIRQQIGSQARLELGRDVMGVEQSGGTGDQARVQAVLDEYFQWEIDAKLANPEYEPVSWLWLGNGVVSTSLVGKAVPKVQNTINAALPEGDRWTVRLAANPWGFNEQTPELCGDACNDILIGVTPVFAWGETERSAGMSSLMAVHANARGQAKQEPSLFRNHHYVRGYAAAVMWHRGVEEALEDGKSRPTGDDIKDALNALRDEALNGLTAGPLSLAPDDHRSQTRYNVYTIDADGDLVFDGDGSIQPSNLWLGY
jgi:ABC-type branched-subunit amino acid transport system substrate-binding protein